MVPVCVVVVKTVVVIVVVVKTVVVIVVVVNTVVVMVIVDVRVDEDDTIVVVVSVFFGARITNFNNRARVIPRIIIMTNIIITITAKRRCHHLGVLLFRGRFSL